MDAGSLPSDVQATRLSLLAWWDEHGRHDIPWKQPSAAVQPDPYGIWIAEVMLCSAA